MPLEGAARRDRSRTRVHVDGMEEPLVASRSEKAIAGDVEAALSEVAAPRRRRRTQTVPPGQERLI